MSAKRQRSTAGNSGICSPYCCDGFKSDPIGFGINDGMYKGSSGWGICLTLLCVLMAVLYATEKLFVQTQLTSYSVTHQFDPTREFGRQDGFNLAFAFTPYGGDLS